MRKVLPAFLMGFLLSAAPVLAATITTSSVPSSIGSVPFTLDVTVSGAATNSANYLRVDLFKEATTNYFGETYNGSVWYGGSTGSAYLQVTIGANGTVNTPITARVGSPSVTRYPGPGQYKLRIRRYTASGSAASDIQTPADVYIDIGGGTPTPTVEPTVEPTKEPTPTIQPTIEPTTAPTVTPTIEPTAEPTVTPTGTPTETPIPEPTATETPVPTITPIPTITPTPVPGHEMWPFKCHISYRHMKILWFTLRVPRLICERI